MKRGLKQKFISGAFILLASTAVIKVISAVYKIPLTAYIGATGRGYFSVAYNLYMPFHAVTMGAFPIALTKLVSTYNARGEDYKISALKKASSRLFLLVGIIGIALMLLIAKPYTAIVSSPNSLYTIFALAPCIFFSCISASKRAFAEGYLDMKATAVSQMLEAMIKMIFGLLFARFSMSLLYNTYLQTGAVFSVRPNNENDALLLIYPITSACAMLGAVLGDIVSYIFLAVYDKINYPTAKADKVLVKQEYNRLLSFSCAVVGATAVQSLCGFIDNSSVQYFLSFCNEGALALKYNAPEQDILSYVFGVYAVALDFKNLIPSLVMALGVTAVPAVSASYEGAEGNFSALLTSIFKYTVILTVIGGLMLSLFPSELLSVLYGASNPDVVINAKKLLFWFGVTALPCCVASITVFCAQSLGFAKNTIAPFVVSAVIRLLINYLLVSNDNVNIMGAVISNFVGFLVIMVYNLAVIRKKTNAKINYYKVFINPVCFGAVTYFAVKALKNTVFSFNNNIAFIVINGSICLLFFLILQILTKSITLSELKRFK